MAQIQITGRDVVTALEDILKENEELQDRLRVAEELARLVLDIVGNTSPKPEADLARSILYWDD